ncbi:calcium-binding protein [Stagnihabitans tardus]|uniref:Peptidase M10 serralysin C-terminal domain-containing protein n=1 Tax=Stagnihabitans tardus TaxID=2699202 RepID=A0AAE4Y6K4_9RHOB|nr:calcium-binding protein [Stagnihabitans tardus]NBZ86042.1 hypothetical protein [Stagnihabitans tardus]
MTTYVMFNNNIGADIFYNLASGDIFLQTASSSFVSWMTVFETGIYATGQGVSVSVNGLMNVGHIDLLGGDQVIIGATATVMMTAAYGFHLTGDLGAAVTTLDNQGSIYSANTPLSAALTVQLDSPTAFGMGLGARLNNKGLISSSGTGVAINEASNGAEASAILVNSGEIIGRQAVTLSGAADRIVNHGQMTGSHDAVIFGKTNQTYDFAPHILNTGTITFARVDTGNPAAAAIALERGQSLMSSAEIVNSGRIDGQGKAIYLDLDSASVTNTGTILGDILSLGGAVTISNHAGKIQGNITTGAGSDTLTNAATLVGSVDLGAGSDIMDLRGGRILGIQTITGGDDSDTYYVSSGSTPITENASDPGIDQVFAESSFRLRNGLENLTLLEGADFNGFGNNLNNTITGNNGENRLFGAIGNDQLIASAGDDSLEGNSGNDTLSGGNGDDILNGGTGTDQLTGGADGDIFRFRRVNEMSKVNPDLITDFLQVEDRIDLSALDANRVNSLSDDAFLFIGTAAFSNVAGQLRYEIVSGTTSLHMDLNGDSVIDYTIRATGSIAFTASDFLL